MRQVRCYAAAVAVLVLAGCAVPPSQAELQTYQAIAPEFVAYVRADVSLTPDAVQRRLDLVEAWAIRVGAKQ